MGEDDSADFRLPPPRTQDFTTTSKVLRREVRSRTLAPYR
jgi:hypothetical protein